MDRIVGKISQILDGIITTLFALIILLTILLVVMRYVFNSSLIGGNEAMEYLFIYTTAIGAAVAVGRREHIGIRFFLEKLPEPAQTAVDILGVLLVAGLNVLIASLSWSWISKVGSSESPVMRIPMATVQASVPIGCILAAFYCIVVVVSEIRGLAGRRSAS